MSITYEIIKSWENTTGAINTMEDILQWIEYRNGKLTVNIEKVDFSYDGFWFYDEQKGYIRNKTNSFFQVAGYQEIENDQIIGEQPIIIQDEIGFLGIICKQINGVLHFLMQAKVEPGNVNVIQISPTIQATKSNFTRQHGGTAPAYLKYFDEAKKHRIIVDQLQSEQSSRFYKKRNRNIIIEVDDDIEVASSHMWMTLGQIKECMKINNLVNMDTRTVLSCIPFSKDDLEDGELEKIEAAFKDKALFKSMFKSINRETQVSIFNEINNCKMYRRENSRLLPLKSLKGWQLNEKEIISKTPYDFKVIYCRIEIEGREVKYWEQPLVEALGMSVIGVFTIVEDGVRKFLVRVKQEMGCFDSAELGPIMQLEPTNKRNRLNFIEKLFLHKMQEKQGTCVDVILSEEGGRFYHEQNRNVIIEVKKEELLELPEGYFWIDFSTLNNLIQFNNCVNIQLRNLVALVEM